MMKSPENQLIADIYKLKYSDSAQCELPANTLRVILEFVKPVPLLYELP